MHNIDIEGRRELQPLGDMMMRGEDVVLLPMRRSEVRRDSMLAVVSND